MRTRPISNPNHSPNPDPKPSPNPNPNRNPNLNPNARPDQANVRILPLLFEALPAKIVQMEPGWMGDSPADVRLGNNVKGGVGQMLPGPGEGLGLM